MSFITYITVVQYIKHDSPFQETIAGLNKKFVKFKYFAIFNYLKKYFYIGVLLKSNICGVNRDGGLL